MDNLPITVWVLLLTAVVGIPAATSAVLYRGAVTTGLGRRTATGVAAAFAAAWGGWLLATGYLAATGVYSGQDAPWLFAAVTGPLVVLLLATRIPLVSRILADPGTPARLALPHTLRVIGVVFLVLMALGHLPAVFAIPAGLGDIAVGVAAPLVYRRLSRDTGHRAALRFNILGIHDLLVAAGIAALVTTGLLQVIPSTEPLRLLPLALVPTAAVPLAIALHIISLRQLRTTAAAPGRGRTAAPTGAWVGPL